MPDVSHCAVQTLDNALRKCVWLMAARDLVVDPEDRDDLHHGSTPQAREEVQRRDPLRVLILYFGLQISKRQGADEGPPRSYEHHENWSRKGPDRASEDEALGAACAICQAWTLVR